MDAASLAEALALLRRANAQQAAAVEVVEKAVEEEVACLASDRAALAGERAALAGERATLAGERRGVDAERSVSVDSATATPRAASTDVVKINVGGAAFEATRAVLTKVEGSLLARMFSREAETDPADGSVFLDRDGGVFGAILDFLKGEPLDGGQFQRSVASLSSAQREAVLHEVEFYGLTKAVFGLNPAAFTDGPPLRRSLCLCAAVAAEGRAFVFGGISGTDMNGLVISNSVEVLDALDGSAAAAFAVGPSLLSARMGCAAVRLDAGRVLVVGGFDGGGCLRSTEVLDISTLAITRGPDLLVARSFCGAVALDSRRILVVGGRNDVFSLASTEVLNLDTMAFEPGPELGSPRQACAAVILDDSRILVAGGLSGNGRLCSTEVLDVRTTSFAPGPDMPAARSGCAAVRDDDSHVLIIGGEDASGTKLKSTLLLDVQTMAFSEGPAMQTARYSCAAARLETGQGRRILVVGGFDDTTFLESTEVLAVPDDNPTNSRRRVGAL